MAALRLVRKWGVPLATAAGAPLLVPVVRAEAGGEGAKETPPAPPTSRMVRPSDLPIYEEPEEVLDFEYHGRERSSLEEGVGVVRKEVEGILEATRSARERIAHIYETGKAHSMATIDYLTDEENMLPRAGAITVGGLAGLVIGARRRGGFIRKVLYTSTGVLTAASLCYPRQAYAVSQQVYGAAKNYGAIGYNFVVGVKPQSKASPPPPPETPKEPEKEVETSATPPTTEDTPPAPAPTPQLQDAEVRSAAALSLPPGKSLIDTLAEQASDVTVWGFRLTDREGTTAPRATSTQVTTPQDALPTVPEGFGSVGTAATGGDSSKVALGEVKGEGEADAYSSPAIEGEKEAMGTPVGGDGGSLVEEMVEAVKDEAAAVREKVAEVEEKLLEMVEEGVIAVGEKVAVVEEKASTAVVEVLTPVLGEEVVEKVETVVEEAVEKVAEMVEEKVAVVVEEAAKEVEEEAAVVEEVVQRVEETGEKVEKVLDVVERVTRAVEKAAEAYPEVPVAEVEKVEKVVEETEAVVENITEAAKVVEGLTEEVRKKAEKVKKEAAEVMESKEKRKEVLEEVVETLEAKATQEKQDAGSVVERQADAPSPQLKEAPQEGQKEVDTPPVAHLTPAVPQEREGLFDKLLHLFSKPDKGAIETHKDEQAASKAAETRVSASDMKTTNTVEEPESVRQMEVEAHSHIEGDKHTAQLPDSEGGAGGAPVGERDNLVEEAVEAVKEGAAAVGEKVTEVEGKVLEMVEEGVIAVGEEVTVMEEKASTAVVEVLTPVTGEEEAKEVVEKVETVVGEAVEKVAEMAEEKVAVVVEEAAKEVEEEAAVVEQVVEVVEETGEKVEKALNVVERVTGAMEEAAEKFRALPVEEVEKVVEVTEATVESITEAAKGLEGLTEEVRKEMEKVEEEAVEVMESEEKRKEVLEKALETLEAKERQDPGVVVEKQDDTLPPHPKEAPQETEVDTPPVEPVTPTVPQEREGLFDKLVSFLSKPDKGVIEKAKEQQTDKEDSAEVSDSFEIIEAAPKAAGEALEHAKKEQITEAPDQSISASSVTQETQETEALMSEVKSEPEPPAPEPRESTTEVTGKSEPDITLKTELEGTEKSLSEIAEKSELETTEKYESDIGDEVVEDKRQEVVEGKEQMEKVEGEKGQVMEEEAGWVMVEVGEKQDKVEEAAGEKLQSVSSEEQDSREVGDVKEEAPGSGAVPTGKREGLFDHLVRLFTKDEKKPVSSSDVVMPQESVPAGAGAGGVPLPGEGEGKELSAGTLGREDEVHPVALGSILVQEDVALVKHEDTVNVPDVSVIPEDTAQVPDVPQVVEDTTQITDTLTVPDVTAQIPSLPTVPDDKAQIPDVAQAPKDTAQGPDVTQVPKDTVESTDVPHIFREEVPATEPGIVETVSGELPDLTQTHEGVVASTEADLEAVSEPVDTLGTEEGEAGVTSGLPLEEPTPPSPPLPPPPPLPPVEKKNLFDKLASLFQKEEQQQEPQLHEAAAEKVKEPLAEAQEPADKVKEDKSPETEQETGSHSGESEVAAVVPESPQEESSSVAPSEDLSLKPLSEPTMEGTSPTGSRVPETVVVTMGGKEEEEANLAAAAETTPQQPQVFSPQVQSSSGGELGQQPSGEVSGETSESVAAAGTQEVHSTQVEEGQPAIQHLASPEAAEGQDKSREPGIEPHTVEGESLAAKPDLAKDTTEPSPGGAHSEGSQISITSQGDTFTVKASPNRPSGVEAQGEDQQQAGVALRPSWLRTEAEVVQEGKDVIIKLEPATPEKDYGQGNPEDSDMYTTRS